MRKQKDKPLAEDRSLPGKYGEVFKEVESLLDRFYKSQDMNNEKSKLDHILDDISKERRNQIDKWGDERDLPLPVFQTILTEEVGEVSEDILERNIHGAKEELIQVAAVAVAMIERIDRFHDAESRTLEEREELLRG